MIRELDAAALLLAAPLGRMRPANTRRLTIARVSSLR
jgi:hypothetical protein